LFGSPVSTRARLSVIFDARAASLLLRVPEKSVINLNLTAATRLGVNLLALLAGIMALYLGQTIFIPTIIALLLASMLWPVTVWLHQRLHVRWTLACLTVISGLVLLNLLITLGFALAVPRLLQVVPGPRSANIDESQQLQNLYELLRTKLSTVLPLDDSLFPEQAQDSGPFMYIVNTLRDSVPEVLKKILFYGSNWLWQGILILFILLFLLLEGRMLIRRFVEVFGPSPEAQAKAGQVLSDMAHQVRTYLVWRTIINFGMAVTVGIVFQWAKLSQPWTWAMLTAILFYIPYMGPIIAGVFPVADAFLSVSPLMALGILVFYGVVTVLEGYLVFPLVLGRNMEMNATTVMLACLFWELVWGPLGLFLAMPLMAAVKAICYHVPGLRPWANLMSLTDTEPAPEKPVDPQMADTVRLPPPDEAEKIAVRPIKHLGQQEGKI
jgi:predicted PurR-regulated permease PerM